MATITTTGKGFNAVAFQQRIDKAAERARKASVRSADMDQRIAKRKERLAKSLAAARKNKDDALKAALVDKVQADVGMAECDQKKAALNAVKLSAYTRQLERELVLKGERAAAKADKASKGPAVWGVKTPDGTVTPIANGDGSFGKLVGRSKVVEMGVDTFSFLMGDTALSLLMDVENTVIVCNEMTYTMEAPEQDGTGESNTVVLVKQ